MWHWEYLDAILVPSGVLILTIYHLTLWRRIQLEPTSTTMGANSRSRLLWVENILEEKKDLLSVHTLRNVAMTAATMTSTSIFLTSAVTAIAFNSADKLSSLNYIIFGAKSHFLNDIKLLALLICFLYSFFCYSQCIRYFSHIPYLICVPKRDGSAAVDKADKIHRVLQRGHNFLTLGHRGYYFGIPFLLWLFGPIPMFITSILMTFLLSYMDSSSVDIGRLDPGHPMTQKLSKISIPSPIFQVTKR